MKIKALILMALTLGLSACSGAKGIIDVDNQPGAKHNMNQLGEFTLVSPTNGMIVADVKEFRWNASNNAETYTIEISSSDQFQSDIESVDYYKRENIVGTSFKINSEFAFKDVNYYWRVAAKNGSGSKYCEEMFSFHIQAPDVEEVKFDLGEADDWSLHNLGSKADISMDNSNFFGNDDKSLKISFKKEDTSRGNPESDGWIIVSKVIEKSIYGTDALYFNCFYAGQDSTIFIRLIDRDNEFWHCQIQLSYNAQQSVILRFSDFVQRTGDVTVANEQFDFERIKYMEVVFERTFGDGVFLLSDVKAIKFANYQYMFIDKLDFSEYSEDQYVYENYDFERKINDKYELELSYYSSTDGGHKKINGYGFSKVVVNRYMFSGDAIKLSVKYQGPKGSNVVLRIYEEDTDRWSYKIPFSSLTEGEYKTLVIPYAAFAKSQVPGDGKRQFYYIINIQFGLEGQYSTGKLFFKDFEVVNKKDYITEEKRLIANDGLVEDFSTYEFAADMYRIWTLSVENKDEYMLLNDTVKIGSNNKFCGQLNYKADMQAALYYLPVTGEGNFTSISLWLKDGTQKPLDNPNIDHLESVNPDVCVYIRLSSGEIYVYELKALAKIWYQYDIPFSAFTLTNETDLRDKKQPITTAQITHIGISIQYFYYDKNGKPMPLYAMDNPVYVDDIYLTNYQDFHMTMREKVVHMEDDIAMIDDFESYKTNEEMLYFWNDGKAFEYQHKELSDYVSSKGGKQSLKLQFKRNADSPSYVTMPVFDSSVASKGFKISIASEGNATVYVNFYVATGTSTVQHRMTLTQVNEEWTEYVVGFDNLTNESGSGTKITSKSLVSITKVTIGIVLWSSPNTLSNIYIDNFAFDNTIKSYATFTKTIID